MVGDISSGSANWWRALCPAAHWLSTYRAQWLPRDLLAGVTLAAYAVPVSMAYAALAGLPPQSGIYCYLFGNVLYAVFGTSRQLAIGPTSAISLLVGVTVAGMAHGDPVRWTSIAALTALLVACLSVLAWALRLSTLINFIGDTILVGFKAGAALSIAMTQLPKLFGVPGGGEHFFARVWVFAGQLGDTHLVVLACGLAALTLLVLGERFLQGRPVPLLVVAFHDLESYCLSRLDARQSGSPHTRRSGACFRLSRSLKRFVMDWPPTVICFAVTQDLTTSVAM